MTQVTNEDRKTDFNAAANYYDHSSIVAWIFSGNNRFYHFGYWDEGIDSHKAAFINENKKMAEGLNIHKGMTVLDAGCGWGSSSVWLAETYGVHVHGITLAKDQVRIANKLAKKRNVSHLVQFSTNNYTNTHFPNESFDLIWFQEADTHVSDPTLFYKEFNRLLKPGGIITGAEYWRYEPSYQEQDEKQLRLAFNLSASPPPATLELLLNSAKNCGFKVEKVVDWHDHLMKSFKRLYRLGLVFYIPSSILYKMNLCSSQFHNSVHSAFHYYKTYKKRLWTIGLIRLMKI